MPRSEWVAITDGGSDDKPRFSYDDKLLFFRVGPGRLSAHLGAKAQTGHAAGRHAHRGISPGQKQEIPVVSDDEIGVGPQRIVFTKSRPPAISGCWSGEDGCALMQAERWKRIEELCQVALELAPEKRARVPGAGLCGLCTARAAKGLQALEIGDVAKGRRLLSGLVAAVRRTKFSTAA